MIATQTEPAQGVLDFERRRDVVAREPTLDEKFNAFHAANPHVLRALLRLARAEVERGATRVGVKHLVETLRADREFQTEHGEGFKLNNVLVSRYARKLVEVAPELDSVIERRRSPSVK